MTITFPRFVSAAWYNQAKLISQVCFCNKSTHLIGCRRVKLKTYPTNFISIGQLFFNLHLNNRRTIYFFLRNEMFKKRKQSQSSLNNLKKGRSVSPVTTRLRSSRKQPPPDAQVQPSPVVVIKFRDVSTSMECYYNRDNPSASCKCKAVSCRCVSNTGVEGSFTGGGLTTGGGSSSTGGGSSCSGRLTRCQVSVFCDMWVCSVK